MTKIYSIRFFATAIFCLLFGIGQALAQGGAATGQITGVVSDPTGAVIPNAAVTITNQSTNQTQTANTSDDGVYRFVLLQPAVYTVKVSSTGFGEQTQDVQVQVGRTLDANFTLGAAGTSATVEVTAEGVQTTSSQSDALLNETAIENLPINGRRFQDFVTLTPSAQVEGSRGQISLSGQRGINGNVNVDGVDFNQPFFGGIRGGERKWQPLEARRVAGLYAMQVSMQPGRHSELQARPVHPANQDKERETHYAEPVPSVGSISPQGLHARRSEQGQGEQQRQGVKLSLVGCFGQRE